MINVLWVALGSALGGVARYYAGIWVVNAAGVRTPATVLVNVVGSFVIGAFLTLSVQRSWANSLVLFVAVGVLGGFTTFSTFAWQTYEYGNAGDINRAILNVAASVALGLLAVWAGAVTPRLLHLA